MHYGCTDCDKNVLTDDDFKDLNLCANCFHSDAKHEEKEDDIFKELQMDQRI